VSLIWRRFAARAFWFWLAAHALAAIVIALTAAIADLPPPEPGIASGSWMVAVAAALLVADITRNRERLLLHDLGVRLRVLVPLVLAPVAVLEAVVVLVRIHVG
jgi:hypothetical protein